MRFSEHFRQNFPLRTLEMAFRASRFQNFPGEKTPRPAKPFTRSALTWFVGDWKIPWFYILKRLDSLDYIISLNFNFFPTTRNRFIYSTPLSTLITQNLFAFAYFVCVRVTVLPISFAFESETGKTPFSRTFWHLFNKNIQQRQKWQTVLTKGILSDKKRRVISDWLFFGNSFNIQHWEGKCCQ